MRRTGRPRIDPADQTTRVCIALASRRYDELYQRATAARVSVPDLIRHCINVQFLNTKSTEKPPRR